MVRVTKKDDDEIYVYLPPNIQVDDAGHQYIFWIQWITNDIGVLYFLDLHVNRVLIPTGFTIIIIDSLDGVVKPYENNIFMMWECSYQQN